MVSIGDLFEDLITLIQLKFYSKTESDDKFIQKNNTTGLVKNDGSVDTNTYLTSDSLNNYVQKSNTNGLLKNDGTVDNSSYLTSSSLSNYVEKSNTNGLLKNDGTVDQSSYLTSHQDISGKLDINQGSNSASKNVVTDSNGDITVEDKPSIPNASNTLPSADTENGEVGSGVTWARSNHKHPKSDLYAEAIHSHEASDVFDENSYSNLGVSADSSQASINSAINTSMGESVALITGTEIPSDRLVLMVNTGSFSTYSSSPFTFTGDNLIIDWGDDTTPTTYTSGKLSHTYSTSGTYTIIIEGDITGFDDECFKNCISLLSVRLPVGVSSISESCFENCTGLSNITIPSYITSIDENCFKNCTGLTGITFERRTPPTVTDSNAWTNLPVNCIIYVPINDLGLYLVANNYPNPNVYQYVGATRRSIDSIIDGDLRTVTSNAVYDALQESTITPVQTISNGDTTHFPSSDAVFDALSLKQDASSAFSGDYTDLTNKPTIPDVSLKVDKTGGVSQITDTNSYSTIGVNANSTQATINNAINTKIGDAITLINGTGENEELVFVFTGDSFSSYDNTPFTFTNDNLIIDWGDGTTQTTYTSGSLTHNYSNSGTYTVRVTGEITGLDCFRENSNITQVILPSTLLTISDNCFDSCSSLVEVNIPSSVSSIGEYSFKDCTNLASISFRNTTPPVVDDSNAWTNLPTSCKLFVPMNSVEVYTHASNYPNRNTYRYIGADKSSVNAIVEGDNRAITSNAVYEAFNELSILINGTGETE